MIRLDGVRKLEDRRSVLDVETLAVADGEIAAVTGGVGSGKDELFDLLTGRASPTVGSVQIAGLTPAADREALSHSAGILFPDDLLYVRQSPLANLALYCRLYGLPRARASEVLQVLGLAEFARARFADLTPGMARRLALGRAIVHDPPVLLLADPFARCDEPSIALIDSVLRKLADAGKAILIVSGESTHLDALCSTIYVLDGGQIVNAYQPGEQWQQDVPFKVPARLEDKVALINPADILFVEADGGRAAVQTTEGRLPTQFTLAELESRLKRSGFFRAHRGYLVNLQHVKEIIPYTRSSYSLRLDDDAGTLIPLSKSAAAELREIFGY